MTGCLRHAQRTEELDEILPVWRRRWLEANALEQAYPQRLHHATLPGRARLPAPPADFTGRDAELSELDRLGADDGRARIVVVCGTAGVGKTALALSWGHRARHRFPDGRLYVNLRGYDTAKPLLAMEALTQLLPALGVPTEEIPSNVDTAAGLYRGLLDGQRVLVVLDNARDPDQVRPLLPAADGCVAVVTSRDRLSGLVARDGAKRVALGPLGNAEALSLLAEIVGEARLAREPQATRELVRACANLPLALRVAAANLADRPSRRIDTYLRQLAAEGAAPADDPYSGLNAALDLSYDTLGTDEAALLRLLGLVPGPDFTAGACAALADIDPVKAAHLLERLAAAHLVQEHTDDRYTFHDLLRAYAVGKLREREEAPICAGAVQRLFDWYLHSAHAAAAFLYPQPPRFPLPPAPAAAAEPSPATAVDALAWLDRERPNLVALIVPAPGQPHRTRAWRLAAELSGYFWRQTATDEWDRVAQAALASAEADGDPAGQASALMNLRRIQGKDGRTREIAAVETDRALLLARELGWRDGEIFALNSVASARIEIGMLASAARSLHAARLLLESDGYLNCPPMFLFNLARVYHRWGEPALATAYARQAFDHYARLGARGEQAVGRMILSMVARDRGDTATAEEHARAGVALAVDMGDRHIRAYNLVALAAALHDLGRDGEATDAADEALALARELEVPQLAGYALIRLADADLRAGRHPDALSRHVQALRIGRRTGYQTIKIFALAGLAQAQRVPQPQRVSHAEAALADANATGARLFAAQLSNVLAAAHRDAGQPERARRCASRALDLSLACAHYPGVARARALLTALEAS
ncbi:ATP-binding protein [Phytohabitans rumicis]|uniref:ATP-binding protein n=1 Tax=Phytohabitans rumicis TaxID=1076125 RepID=UPI001563DDF6|nr:NB-ARC domain-containing protein [Phytohabitans rumicis]